MAESEDGQEKSEDPSSRKIQKAREEGNIARSKELSALLLMLGGGLALLVIGEIIANNFVAVFSKTLSLEREQILDISHIVSLLENAIFESIYSLLPLFAFLAVSAVIGNIALGGYNFSVKALTPKLNRLNPISGLKRLFSVKSLVELVKSLGKFLLVGATALFVIYLQLPDMLALGKEPTEQAIMHTLEMLIWAFIWVSTSLILIVVIDIPFQIWQHTQQLKMTKKEVKDESRDAEGKPEVKGKIRQLQMEMAQRRMMDKVPEADVVITNPTHYSVALRYDANESPAPVVLAKGVDHTAFKIREIAKEHRVPLITAPPLARAIYYTTELGDTIPSQLYLAVAQVLAYVFRLNAYQKGQGPKPGPTPQFPVPDDFVYERPQVDD